MNIFSTGWYRTSQFGDSMLILDQRRTSIAITVSGSNPVFNHLPLQLLVELNALEPQVQHGLIAQLSR
jgi:hypothetical protein